MGRLITASWSELDTARQCPLKHQLSYVDRWTTEQAPDSALAKGTAWHQVMEIHYNILREWNRKEETESQVLVRCRLAVDQQLSKMPFELAELIRWMYEGYASLYGADPSWDILAVEHAATVWLPTARRTRSNYRLKVKIDLVVKDRQTRNVYVVDHKSGKDLPGKRALEFDDQFPLYTWAMHQLGRKVFGQLYNAARTLRLEADKKAALAGIFEGTPGNPPKGTSKVKPTPLAERFQREPMYRVEEELWQVAIEAYLTFSARYRQQREVTAAGIVSPRHTNGMTCPWRCDFKEPCLGGRKGIEMTQFLRNKGFRQDFSRH